MLSSAVLEFQGQLPITSVEYPIPLPTLPGTYVDNSLVYQSL